MRRWKETIDWAATNGCTAIIESIADTDFYEAEKPTEYRIGPLGGPCYRPWDFERKQRPGADELARYLNSLSARWAEIAGPSLATLTHPLAFTGRKARRLLVRAEKGTLPPWGGWSYLSPDEATRRAFTRLRSAINEVLAPHEVDHVDFTTEQIDLLTRR
jgi:hypothetical protein